MKKSLLITISIAAFAFSLSSKANSEGEAMYEVLGCLSCHGQAGRSSDENYPSLAGKDVEWIVQQLENFQSGERQNEYMNAMAPMAEGFERSIAEYLSIQNPNN